MSPGCGHAIAADTDFHSMREHGPVVAALHIVLTRPDQFDRSAAQTLGDHGCFTLDVRVRRGAPAEPASGQFGMKRYLLQFQAQHFSDCHTINRLKLRASPYLGAITIKS